jgi:hypothetical protein
MEFTPGQVPTLDTVLAAGFTRVEDEPVKKSAKAAQEHA